MLPSGMGFAPATRIFAGTPDAPFHDSCAYTVTDSSQPAETFSEAVEVEVTSAETQPLALRSEPPQASFIIGEFRPYTLPEATGGVEPYTYTFTCEGGSLPPGIGFSPATRVLAGVADAVFHASCTYTVTDSAQPAATVSRNVVVSTQSLTFQSEPPQEVRFVIGDFDSFRLPAATGGVAPYTYTFTCASGRRPPGVGFTPATRVLAGDTDAVFDDLCTYTVTDSSQPAETFSQDIVVTSAAPGSLALPDNTPEKIRFVIGDLGSFTLPVATGGVAPYTYTFACDGGSLPRGVGFAPATRRLAGVADVADAAFDESCTYRVTDSAQPAATVSKDIEVTVESFALPDTPEEVRFVIGESRSFTLPAATGGVAPYTYDFACDGGSLPSKVNFAPATRRLAGIADAVFDDSCTYTVTDDAQPAATVSRVIKVTVESLALPDTPEEVHFVIGEFRSFTLPAATRGVAPYTYTFTCDGGSLPRGVGFAPATRRLAGVADVADAAFDDSCTYTVTNAGAMVMRDIEVTVESLTLPDTTPEEVRFVIDNRGSFTLPHATGGEAPYTYTFTCDDGSLPRGVSFAPATPVPADVEPVLSGVADAVFHDSCTYTVTDSARPAVMVSRDIEVVVVPLDRGRWRFLTRTLERSDHLVDRTAEGEQTFVTLPHAFPETGFAMDSVTYRLPPLPDIRSPLGFDPDSRQLSYTHTGVDPIFNTPTTFRYEVCTHEPDEGCEAQDALCVDVSYHDLHTGDTYNDEPDGFLDTVSVWIRDDAFWDKTRAAYRCPDAPRMSASSSGATVSNPVHTALAPVHARRALDVAHGAVLDRVRGWTPGESSGDAQVLSAIAPTVGIGSLSGRSEGFDYSGSSESLSTGAELGAGTWQAGVVGSFTRTELDYRADASLAEHGYVAGEHDTEVLSLHPFAAWHTPSGGHVWASLGAGTGELRHRDDPGFPSWSRSDVHLRTWAAGASVPVADILSGDLQAEAGIESFSFDIDGGGRISSSLPTLRGRDWRTGLAWSAPVPGAPSVAVAYRRLTGDGPEGGRLETRGSVSVEGIFDPRLALLANAEGAFGLGDYEHDFWGLTGGVRFAPDGTRRGFGLELDTRFESLEEDDSAGVGIRAEAGYGLWGGSWFGTLRPHVGLIRHPGGSFLRRSVGVDLRDTPNTRAKVEVHDHPHHRSPALRFSLHQRF